MASPPVSTSTLIGNLEIGSSVRPKIIAEIGINHCGSIDTAKRMSELAVSSGADIVKTQMHIPHAEMSPAAKSLIPGHCSESIYEIMESCSLPPDQEYDLKNFIESLGAQYMCTPFSSEAAHILGDQFKVNSFKIGSGECNNPDVLSAVAQYQKPIILSTGMNSLASCRQSYDFLVSEYQATVFLLHTTNIYPTPSHLVRLGGITELQQIAGADRVGLSDHTVNNLACLGAVSLGAVLLERHFTDSKDREGPDIANSMDPHELSELRSQSEEMFNMRGGSKVIEISEEQGTRDFAFATYVALKNIQPGEVLTNDNIAPKRPALGDFFSRDGNKILNTKAACTIDKGEHILMKHIQGLACEA